jgi:hypothetical protein
MSLVTHQGVFMRINVATRDQKHRAGLRALGLCPVQIWVPDTRNGCFVEERRRQPLALYNELKETKALKGEDASADVTGWI